ncbi:MAG: queuosine precursor transporter [Actinobacteria bacterium]|jgi:queuosine precursor transporter|nr:queuosine precursor transporter [Actinomycetota bacterium]MDA2975823.1 queuosine precursor transporter [Actinomycetota bacterium]
MSDQLIRYSSKSLFPIIAAVFVALLLLSNISAVKLIEFGPLITDGGLFLFPLVYIVGDVLTEVYGFKAAKRVIYTGFAIGVLAAFTYYLVQIAPPAASWENQAAFESILGFVPQIVIASVLAFLAGQLLNSWVLVKVKAKTNEKKLWLRLISSTAVGQLADTVVFTMIASLGRLSFDEFLNYLVVGYLYKTLIEVLLLPITYRVIARVKAHEAMLG